MQDLDVFVFVSVFQEMLGAYLWIGFGAALLVMLLFVGLLVREGGVSAARLARSELVGLVGGVVAILVMQAVTHSGFADIGGPIDWVLVALIWLTGAVIGTLAAYVGLGLIDGRRRVPAATPVPAARSRVA